MERVKYSKVEVKHGNSSKKFPVYEIYLDGMIVQRYPQKSKPLRWYHAGRKYTSNKRGIYT